MTTNGIFRTTISLLEKSLNLRSMQHRVLASNIANMDTPNYKAVELDVAEEMNKNRHQGASPGIQLKRTRATHLPVSSNPTDAVKIKIAKSPEFSLRGDGNTVDLDRTMGKLSENNLLYRTSAQLISRKFRGLKNAIKGGSS
jgi:flagellar basal-body rod protein FlgB